jgi:virulence factor Mce-like protein
MSSFKERDPRPIAVIGLVVLTLATLVGLNAARLPLLHPTHTYTLELADSVGLQPGNDVSIAGIRVGHVTGVKVVGDKVVVTVDVEAGQRLGDATTASVELATLLGTKYVALVPAGDAPLTGAIPLSRTSVPFELPALLTQLGSSAGTFDQETIQKALATLTETMHAVQPSLQPLLDGLAQLSTTVAGKDKQLGSLLTASKTVTASLAEEDDRLVAVMGDADLVLLLVGRLAGAWLSEGGSGLELAADFSRSTSVYEGNPVTVLGVTSGRVVALEPDGAVVHVRIRLNPGVKVPADVKAALLSRSLVTSRELALTPPYTTGPQLRDGDVIAQDHTFVPLEVDEILANLQQFAAAVGPKGANAQGALGDFIEAASTALGGQGERAHDTAVALGKALAVTDAHAGDLAAVVTNLSTLAQTLAAHDGTVRRFEADLAAASGDLAANRANLAAALTQLADALGQVGTLVRDHRVDVQGSLQDLARTTSALVAHQQQLGESLDLLPTFGQNLAQAVDSSGRVDMRFVNYEGMVQALPFGSRVCTLLGVCDLLPQGIPPPPGARR